MKKLNFVTVIQTRAMLFLTVLALTGGCTFSETKPQASGKAGTITLMTWNLNNLFDGVEDGTEYDEYRKSAGWSEEKYRGRLNTIKDAISRIEPKPDLIVFQEVENLTILDDIAGSLSGFAWSHFANNPEAALGIGIISRLPLTEARVHSITIQTDTTPRPVLEVRVQTVKGESAEQTEPEQTDIVVFACHWKSKLGEASVTENNRKSSARVILRRIRELWETEPELGVIITGDLNENYDEFYRQNGDVISALLPDDPYCAQITGCSTADGEADAEMQKDFLVLSRNKPPVPVNFPQGTVVLFSPWMKELENGSYFYKHAWETIDHFLVSRQFFNMSALEYERTVIVNIQPFTNYSGIPVSYNPKTGLGLSDHLPLLLVLKLL